MLLSASCDVEVLGRVPRLPGHDRIVPGARLGRHVLPPPARGSARRGSPGSRPARWPARPRDAGARRPRASARARPRRARSSRAGHECWTAWRSISPFRCLLHRALGPGGHVERPGRPVRNRGRIGVRGGDRSEQEVTLLEEGRRPGARGLDERCWYPRGRRQHDDRQREGRRSQWSSRPRGRYLGGTARHRRDATAASRRGERRWPGTVPAAAHRAQLGRHDRRVRVGGLHAHQESQRKKRAGGAGQGHQWSHTRSTRDKQPTGAGRDVPGRCACTCAAALRETTV